MRRVAIVTHPPSPTHFIKMQPIDDISQQPLRLVAVNRQAIIRAIRHNRIHGDWWRRGPALGLTREKGEKDGDGGKRMGNEEMWGVNKL